MATTYKVTLGRRLFTGDDGDFAIWSVTREGGEEGGIKGNGLALFEPGDLLEVAGRVGDYKGSWQLAVSSVSIPNIPDAGAMGLLCEASGVGPSAARKIVDMMGTEGVAKLVGQKAAKVAKAVAPAVTPVQAKSIGKHLEAATDVDRDALLLTGHGLTLNACRKVVKALGSGAVGRVRMNPYILTEVSGIGFKTADAYALAAGMAPDDPRRIAAVVIHVVEEAIDEGSCWVESIRVETSALGLLQHATPSLPFVEVTDAIKRLVDEKRLFCVPGLLTTAIMYHTERKAAVHMLRLLTGEPSVVAAESVDKAISDHFDASGIDLTEEQIEAVWIAVENPVSILTGGAGVGKTTTLKAILMAFQVAKLEVVLVAPTGKAAHRMAEVCKHEASTIHRLLKVNPETGRFIHDEDDPVSGRVFVVDEASMVDVRLLTALLRAIPDDARLLFVGDENQLQSVGPGAVLRDLVQCGLIPVSRLTKIQRQAAGSMIVRGGYDILAGRHPEMIEDKIGKEPGAVYWLNSEGRDGKDDPERAVKWALERLKVHGVEPSDVQIMSAMHAGTAGTRALNEAMQAWANPDGQEALAGLRVGDRCIQTKNDYQLGVFNGDTGLVVSVGVQQASDKWGNAINKYEPTMTVDFLDGRIVTYVAKTANSIERAYCVSVHKMQGSEAPYVFLMLHTQHFVMLSRSLAYTGWTRARNNLIIVGKKSALAMAVKDEAGIERVTRLVECLTDAARAPMAASA